MHSPQPKPVVLVKPTLVLLHGWGMHGGVWQTLGASLADDFHVIAPDLPGYGASPACSPYTLQALAETLWASLPPRSHLLGWSLGAKLALQIAQCEPARVDKLVLVAATPSFRARADWPHGLSESALAEFAESVEQDYEATLQRFLSLQARSGEAARAVITQLRAGLFARGRPSLETLRGGLTILRDTDLRASLPAIRHATLLLQGSYDTLVPPAAGIALAQALPNAELQLIPGAAHAPFLSHPQLVSDTIKGFLHG